MAPKFENYDAATASATSMVWRRKVRSSQRTQTTIQSCHVPSANVTCRLQDIRDVYPGTEESGPQKNSQDRELEGQRNIIVLATKNRNEPSKSATAMAVAP